MPLKPDGHIDWSKFFMGFAVAFVFVMQQWHSFRISENASGVAAQDKVIQVTQSGKDALLKELTHLQKQITELQRRTNGGTVGQIPK